MYNYVLEYRPRKYNCLADLLSRNSAESNTKKEICNQIEIKSIFDRDMHVTISAN